MKELLTNVVLFIFVIGTPTIFLLRWAWLEQNQVDISRYHQTSITYLRKISPTRCLIAKKIKFLWKVYYVHKEGILTSKKEIRRYNYIIFEHPGFRWGKIKVYDPSQDLRNFEYWIAIQK